ncbi:MAG: succinylglutamate desuccinylase/aspartoacylase family protein, partial [Verrucomicrobiota bacterium]|nr:succinylglutamate desuccinylase/aspartoacylase family protein [Verrucomicrobiota bacterium]
REIRGHRMISAPEVKTETNQNAKAGRSIRELLLPLFIQVGTSAASLRADSLGHFRSGEKRYWIPRFIFRGRESDEPPMKIGIFAGIHGDELAGTLALIDVLRELEGNPFLGRAYRIFFYPLCNPTGYEDGTRESRSGKDLNREFWKNSTEPEIALLEAELTRQKFDGIISLHSDDTSDGLYGFVRGATLTEFLLKPALAAAEEALPINSAERIDGFHAVNGIIHSAYDGILSAPPCSHPAPFEIVLESPQHSPLESQRQSMVFAVREIIRYYRRMMAFAAGI